MEHDHDGWVSRPDLLDWSELAYVYRCRNVDEIVIYVGKTITPMELRVNAHRIGNRQASPWFREVTAIEALKVSREELAGREWAEIHRWHPVYNKRCPLCSQKGTSIHALWCRLQGGGYLPLLHPPWRTLNAFTRGVLTSIGEPPEGAQFRRIDPQGRFEPGNVYWHKPAGK